MSSATTRCPDFRNWLGSATLVLSFVLGSTLLAGTGPSESTPSAAPSTQQSAGEGAGEASQKPAEKGPQSRKSLSLESRNQEQKGAETKQPGVSAGGPQKPVEKVPSEAPQ